MKYDKTIIIKLTKKIYKKYIIKKCIINVFIILFLMY